VNKSFRLVSLFGVTALLLVMVGAVTAMAAPSAAVTGTITLDKNWYTDNTGSGSAVKVTVSDTDANSKTARTDSDVDLAGGAVSAGSSVRVTLANKPIVGTPIVREPGTTTALTHMDVQVISADLGVIDVITSIALSNDGDDASNTNTDGDVVDISYNTSSVDTLLVTVSSTQVPGGIKLTATETSFDSSSFTVTLNLDSTTTQTGSTPKLQALDLNTITAKYTDSTPASGSSVTVQDTAQVELGKPTFASLTPATGFATQAQQPTITGIINDVGGAGIDVSTIIIKLDADSNTTFESGESFAPTVTGSDGDTTVTFTYTSASLTEGAKIWQVQATDMAGNTGTSDSDSATTAQDNHTMSIDLSPPSISSAETGKYYDSVAKAEKSNSATSLVIRMSEALDANSVAAADWTVEGIAPLTATVVTTNVYLTLGTALASNSTPLIAIGSGGAVSDKAGNSLNVGTKKATDNIAPTFTVDLDKTLASDKVVITIESDEQILGVPAVKVHNITDADTNTIADDIRTLTVLVKATTKWESTFTVTKGDTYEGANSIVITASDSANNSGTKGSGTITSAAFAATAVTFTQDGTAPTITTYKAAGTDITTSASQVQSVDPFVTVTYGEKVTVDKAEFGLKSATTLGDVKASVSQSADGKTVIYSTSALVVNSEYKFNISVTDAAGNKLENQANDFKVIEVAPVSVTLSPGMNLISLPGAPSDTAINTVISLTEVTQVMTYDPVNPDPTTGSPWLTASRATAADSLTGSLTTIDANHAYWVKTSTFEPIKVTIPAQGFAASPPAIPVKAGWNMVPIVSLTGEAIGSTKDADKYFGSLSTNWVTAYSYDPQANAWTKILRGNFNNVTVGKGYWIYTSVDGILVP